MPNSPRGSRTSARLPASPRLLPLLCSSATIQVNSLLICSSYCLSFSLLILYTGPQVGSHRKWAEKTYLPKVIADARTAARKSNAGKTGGGVPREEAKEDATATSGDEEEAGRAEEEKKGKDEEEKKGKDEEEREGGKEEEEAGGATATAYGQTCSWNRPGGSPCAYAHKAEDEMVPSPCLLPFVSACIYC